MVYFWFISFKEKIITDYLINWLHKVGTFRLE